MKKQIIISISREYGSGGHFIAEALAKKLRINYYDRNNFRDMLIKKGISLEEFKLTDETPRSIFIARTVNGFNNSFEDYVAHEEFKMIKELADKGESFVVVGRCADYVLKGHPALTNVFIWADDEYRMKRVVKLDKVSKLKAKIMIEKNDKKRAEYHNAYCKEKWGKTKSYDLTINCSYLKMNKVVELIIDYIKNKSKISKL